MMPSSLEFTIENTILTYRIVDNQLLVAVEKADQGNHEKADPESISTFALS
jgi:hypothetical protein